MRRDPEFFAYDPRALRVAVVLCAVACVALAAWSLAQATATGELSAWARTGLALGLLGAFGYVFWRTRPRAGWGVRVDLLGLTVSRPSSGEPIELEWSDIAEVRREGRRRERLVVVVRPEGRLLLQRHLFPSKGRFEALTASIDARASRSRHDA